MAAPKNRDRLIEAAMAILEAAGGPLNIVVLNKALFYLDLYALRDHGQTVTGQAYVALPMGPVVAKYDKRLVGELEKRGLAEQFALGKAKPVQVTTPLGSFPHLSADEVALAREIGTVAADATSWGVSEFSHDNAGWRIAFEGGLGGPNKRPKLVDMNIALQQLVEEDDDPWMSEPVGERSDPDVCEAW